jgi:hypothetical protein
MLWLSAEPRPQSICPAAKLSASRRGGGSAEYDQHCGQLQQRSNVSALDRLCGENQRNRQWRPKQRRRRPELLRSCSPSRRSRSCAEIEWAADERRSELKARRSALADRAQDSRARLAASGRNRSRCSRTAPSTLSEFAQSTLTASASPRLVTSITRLPPHETVRLLRLRLPHDGIVSRQSRGRDDHGTSAGRDSQCARIDAPVREASTFAGSLVEPRAPGG